MAVVTARLRCTASPGPCPRGGLGDRKRSEALARVAGLGVGQLPLRGIVRGGEVGPERDLRDVGDSRPPKPVAQVRLLVVRPEAWWPPRTVDSAGVEDGGLLVAQQARIASLGI